ncbi:hypothetical protein JYB64_06105 [Algoriphagus aestuarii]|nr:hypothetical protein [Algoriphagus aestuarii]
MKEELPVLGVHNLELASAAVKSIGSFRALILDWQYGDERMEVEDLMEEIKEELGQKGSLQAPSQKEDAAFHFLNENDFYSLIYIFSEIDIEESYGSRLKEKFGDRIKFKKKENFNRENVGSFKEEILLEIEEWKVQNQNLSVPIQWSVAINESIQKIFKELAEAESHWLKELYGSATNDGVDPELFVIELMQLILSESVIQNKDLLSSIMKVGKEESSESSISNLNDHRRALSKLFSRLFYSELKDDTPIMTGDICQLSKDKFGVLITPECDIRFVKEESGDFEFLIFGKESMNDHLLKHNSYKRSDTEDYHSLKEKRKEGLRELFNQENGRFHFLPSFPLFSDDLNQSCAINFRNATKRLKSTDVINLHRKYKINSPFIQQLRQRYLAYIGRIGTPALPSHVRDWNLQ